MASEFSRESTLSYQLPPTVESIRSGWISITRNAVTVSSLFAVVGALLMAFFNDDKNFKRPQSGVQEAILTLTYAEIILSISATIGAFSLTDEFAEIASRASRNPHHTGAYPARAFKGENWDILRYFGARKSSRWIIYHWLVCLLLAILCAIASIVLYAATQGTHTRIIISVVTGVATLPPIFHFFVPF